MINSTVIVGDKGVILVDSGGSDEAGRHIAKAVRKITDKPYINRAYLEIEADSFEFQPRP
jgi:hypothetical protein